LQQKYKVQQHSIFHHKNSVVNAMHKSKNLPYPNLALKRFYPRCHRCKQVPMPHLGPPKRSSATSPESAGRVEAKFSVFQQYISHILYYHLKNMTLFDAGG